jgi:hypothetical protein
MTIADKELSTTVRYFSSESFSARSDCLHALRKQPDGFINIYGLAMSLFYMIILPLATGIYIKASCPFFRTDLSN